MRFNTKIKNSVRFPSTLRTTGDEAFGVCIALRDTLFVPSSLEYIGSEAFAYCDSLRMGRNVRQIDSYCFTGCHNLKEVVILSPAPPEVEPTTFNQLPPDAKLYVLAQSVDAYRTSPGWSGFRHIEAL